MEYLKSAIDFLNKNSGAIQAVATVVLVLITGAYVALTRSLLKHQQKQAQALRRQAHIGLHSLSKRLLNSVESLSQGGANDRIREAALWESEDVRDLESFAAQFGPDASEHAAKAAQGLLYLRDKIIMVKATNPGHGFKWDASSLNQWSKYLSEAGHSLTALVVLTRLQP